MGVNPVGPGLDDADWWRSRKARVFISCGQKTSKELAVACEVRDRLRASLFCPYLAVAAHSSKSLTEEVFRKLRTADYFLFLDFRREPRGFAFWRRRGSLFSNQELAIAAFLDLDILPFQQRGVGREGILAYIGANAVPFSRIESLPDLVMNTIASQGWNSTSRRELVFERDPSEHDDPEWPDGTSARYFHISIVNPHPRQAANECRVFLDFARDVQTGKALTPDPVEVKFKHVTSPFVSIAPGQRRPFDAVVVPHERPSVAVIGILNPALVDSGRAILDYTLPGPADYSLQFTAWSREFAPVSVTASLHVGKRMNDVALRI